MVSVTVFQTYYTADSFTSWISHDFLWRRCRMIYCALSTPVSSRNLQLCGQNRLLSSLLPKSAKSFPKRQVDEFRPHHLIRANWHQSEERTLPLWGALTLSTWCLLMPDSSHINRHSWQLCYHNIPDAVKKMDFFLSFHPVFEPVSFFPPPSFLWRLMRFKHTQMQEHTTRVCVSLLELLTTGLALWKTYWI